MKTYRYTTIYGPLETYDSRFYFNKVKSKEYLVEINKDNYVVRVVTGIRAKLLSFVSSEYFYNIEDAEDLENTLSGAKPLANKLYPMPEH